MSIEMAITRRAHAPVQIGRYMETHLSALGREGGRARKPIGGADRRTSDFFKSAMTALARCGDDVLREFDAAGPQSIRNNRSSHALWRARSIVHVMPDTDMAWRPGGRAAAPPHRHRAVRDPAGHAQFGSHDPVDGNRRCWLGPE